MKLTKRKQAAIFVNLQLHLLMCSTINNAVVFLKCRRRRKARINTLERLQAYVDKQMAGIKSRKPRMTNKCRSSDWWDNIVWTTGDKFTDADWLENFRMTKNTFVYLCKELRDALDVKPNRLNIFWQHSKLVTVEKKVAMSLYYLASCCEYRVVANQFGVHKSTICKTVHEFVTATNKILTPKHIHMPSEAEAVEIARCFEHSSHIPNIVGAIDGTHIPILPPTDGYRDYVNRKGWPSMVLQGVVDHQYKFIDISIKNPGATHDSAVLTTSNLYKNIDDIIPKGTVKLNGRDLRFIIIGDPAYPLLPRLMKGYTDRGLTANEDSFNAYMNSARVAVEIAFGRLKARWRCLLKRLDVHHSFVPHIVATCCTLHNIVETFKDKFVEGWSKSVADAEIIFNQPTRSANRNYVNYEGYDMRIFLTEYLSDHYSLRTSKLYVINKAQQNK